jgi:KUP system potassium uptake protein
VSSSIAPARSAPTPTVHGHPPAVSLWAISLAALGVVYGDIGTSPLYALRECFYGPHAVAVTPLNVLGVLSLIFWALVIVVSVKYLSFVMRADNQGEGGILALMALVPAHYRSTSGRTVLIGLGLFGAALLYGDGMITPAISVLGAIEGLTTATPVFQPYVVPITVAVLVALFLLQYRGTARVGALFGPVMIVWFVAIAGLGARSIAGNLHVLQAINPAHAVRFFAENGFHGFLVLGSVFLVVTGGEALYADMGHFGKRPIRLAWFSLVQPALMLNYFGQGALLLQHPEHAEQPFYLLAPGWLLYPLVALATIAAVIASQALISAVFSLTRQAVQLGYSPRLDIQYTSAHHMGQIYIPQVNWALMIATIAIVLTFRSSSALAAAYGIAVTMTMATTTILAYVVSRQVWGWNRAAAGIAAATFIIVDLAFFGANALKVAHGGWVPLVIAWAAFTLMTTWKRGREIVGERLRSRAYPFPQFLADISANPPHRVEGTAVFMTGTGTGTPPTLLHNLEHNRVLHEQVILLTVVTADTPLVPDDQRLKVEPLAECFYRVILSYGFMEEPDVPAALKQLSVHRLHVNLATTTFFLGRETLLATDRPGMALWRERLFVVMSMNAMRATTFFKIPSERVVELGMQLEL